MIKRYTLLCKKKKEEEEEANNEKVTDHKLKKYTRTQVKYRKKIVEKLNNCITFYLSGKKKIVSC
jgi:superfamily I DNA and/or RNA helicase